MSKMLLIANGPQFIAAKACEEFKKYFDEVKVIGYPFATKYDYEGFDKEAFKENCFFVEGDDANVQKTQIWEKHIDECDFIFGIEHSAAIVMPMLMTAFQHKKIDNKIMGLQVLDYPVHVFSVLKDLSHNTLSRWQDYYLPNFAHLDIILHNQVKGAHELTALFPNALHGIIRYPVCTQEVKTYSRKNYILYAGRIDPDKGNNYVIEALSVLPFSIPFKIITSSSKEKQKVLLDYAKYLNVDLEIIDDCSESLKWKMLHECRFTVCGADNEYIAGLSPIEGISVGRLAIVFDTEENRFHYDRFAMYCQMRNIDSLANCIKSMYMNPKLPDDHAQDGPAWVKEHCSFSAWAKDIYEAYCKVKEKK